MEALILIFGELVFAILAPFVMIVVDLVGSMLGFAISLFGRGRKSGSTTPRRSTRAAGTMAKVLAGFAVLIVAALWVANSFYFEHAVRYVFDMTEQRSGVKTDCEQIDGSLFRGHIDLQSCTIRRPAHPLVSFELSAETIELDISLTSLLGTAHIETAWVAGLAGWVTSNRNADDEANESTVEKPRRAFEIGDLDISRSSIQLSGINRDGNPFEIPVEIQSLKSQPLRSRLALFDILFRSNAAGSIAGAPFELSTAVIEDGRETRWRAEQVPVASFGALVGRPLSWFSAGVVNVSVDDRWQRGDSLDIDMDWRLEFEDIEIQAPPGTGTLTRMAAEPLARFVNASEGRLPLEFQLVINESQFTYQTSLAAAGLWSAVGEAINKLLVAAGVDLEAAAEVGGTIKEGAKSVLDRLRKPKSEDQE
jgi:hypothetical protein